MTNAILCAVNHFDSGTFVEGPEDIIYADFSSDYYASSSGVDSNPLPVSNMKDRQLSKVWRTQGVDKTWTWFQVNFGTQRLIDIVSLLSHTISYVGKVRIRLWSDLEMTDMVYDSGYVGSWPVLTSFGVKPWGVWQWGEPIGVVEIPEDQKINFIHILPEGKYAFMMRVDIDDESNSAGYIDIGRCYAGPSFVPSKNISYGFEIRWVDNSESQRSLSGQKYSQTKSKYREAKFSFDFLTKEEVYLNLFEYIDRRKGVVGDVLFIPSPDNPEYFIYEVIYGTMSELGGVVQSSSNYVSKNYVIEELI